MVNHLYMVNHQTTYKMVPNSHSDRIRHRYYSLVASLTRRRTRYANHAVKQYSTV